MMEKHITKLVTERDASFAYIMTEAEFLTVDLVIVSSVSFAADCKITMNAKGGIAMVRCIMLPSQNAVLSLSTHQIHTAPNAKSDVLVKTVIMDGSTVSFQGNICIGSSAKKSDAYQKNENLIFGSGGVINASPVLEILNNDVRCTHGVTTGTIPEDVLWYMNTRGIEEVMAKELYVDGFIRGSIGDIQDKEILEKILNRT